ncbi:MAG TPA: hypothetical protein VNT01_10195 [Symbiobacteriaceae bacterium]|nr:hypothetical protein [Symbiobacteriaceae bacterium]
MADIGQQRRARSRYFTQEQIDKGFGLLILDAPDLSREERDRLACGIVHAYDLGLLKGDLQQAAYGVAAALLAPCATLEALRFFLRCDGRDMVAHIRRIAEVVPPLSTLINWIAL